MRSLLCYTFTGKKLPDFIPYFFEDSFEKNSRFFKVVEYVKVNNELEFQNDFYNKDKNNHFYEVYVILENKIRLHSFSKPVNEYTYCSFRDLCSVLSMSEIGDLDINEMINYYIESGIEYKA